MNYTMKLAGLATLALTLFANPVDAKTIEKSFDVSQGGKLKLETNAGSIRVDSHGDNVVKVVIEVDGDDSDDEDNFKVKFDASGSDVTVTGERKNQKRGFWGNNNVRVHYRVTVPMNYNIDVETAGGSIKVKDLNGNVNAHTSGGSIALGQIDGLVDVHTSGGSINVDEVTGTIKAHTSGGSISARISKQPTGDSKLTTSGGSITAYLVENIAVDLTARTSGGRVRSEFDVNGDIDKKSIVGSINGGGPKLVLKTSGGSVQVNKL